MRYHENSSGGLGTFDMVLCMWSVTHGSTRCMYPYSLGKSCFHYGEVIISAMASQITSLTTVCATVYSGADQRKNQSSASLAFVRGIHRCPVNPPHKGPVTPKMCPFGDVIMPALGQSHDCPNANVINLKDTGTWFYWFLPDPNKIQ